MMTIFMSVIANVTECCCRRISLLRFFFDNSRARVCVCACFKREKKFMAAGGIRALFWDLFFYLFMVRTYRMLVEREEITKEAFCG